MLHCLVTVALKCHFSFLQQVGIDKNDIPELTQVRLTKALFIFSKLLLDLWSLLRLHTNRACQYCVSPIYFFSCCVHHYCSSLKIIIHSQTASTRCCKKEAVFPLCTSFLQATSELIIFWEWLTDPVPPLLFPFPEVQIDRSGWACESCSGEQTA